METMNCMETVDLFSVSLVDSVGLEVPYVRHGTNCPVTLGSRFDS